MNNNNKEENNNNDKDDDNKTIIEENSHDNKSSNDGEADDDGDDVDDNNIKTKNDDNNNGGGNDKEEEQEEDSHDVILSSFSNGETNVLSNDENDIEQKQQKQQEEKEKEFEEPNNVTIDTEIIKESSSSADNDNDNDNDSAAVVSTSSDYFIGNVYDFIVGTLGLNNKDDDNDDNDDLASISTKNDIENNNNDNNAITTADDISNNKKNKNKKKRYYVIGGCLIILLLIIGIIVGVILSLNNNNNSTSEENESEKEKEEVKEIDSNNNNNNNSNPPTTSTTITMSSLSPTITMSSLSPTIQPTFIPGTETIWTTQSSTDGNGNDNTIYGLYENSQSGYSISMSSNGNILAIGGPGAGGTVQVYYKNNNNNDNNNSDKWILIGNKSLRSSDNGGLHDGTYDGYGSIVSLSDNGKILCIGLPNKYEQIGSVFIYNVDVKTNTITLINEIIGINVKGAFGRTLSVSGDGNTIGISVDDTSSSDDGNGGGESVKVYRRNTSSSSSNDNDNSSKWIQIGNTIQPNKSTYSSGFGNSIATSYDGNIIAIGAPYGNYVKVYKYNKINNIWEIYGTNINNNDDNDNESNILIGDNDGDLFGDSISLSSNGNIIAIGSPYNRGMNNDKVYSGTIKIFQLINKNKINSTNTNTNSNNDYYYWEQMGTNIDGINSLDNAGAFQGVKLSSNGLIVGIGSQYGDGSSSNSNGSNNNDNDNSNNIKSDCGIVQIYEYIINNNKWKQISQNIEGQNKGDRSGRSISLSGDGSIVAIGSYRSSSSSNGDDGGYLTGQVSIYYR